MDIYISNYVWVILTIVECVLVLNNMYLRYRVRVQDKQLDAFVEATELLRISRESSDW